MHPSLTIAKRAAYSAAKIILDGYDRRDSLKVKNKRSANDLVTNIDLSAEQAIIHVLSEAFPDYDILSEETGLKQANPDKKSDFCWVIDPLDGTVNFTKGFPHFAISIALLKNDKVMSGLVYQPVTDEMFVASSGQGALLNDRKIRANTSVLQDNAIIEIGFPFSDPILLGYQQKINQYILTLCPDLRRCGSAALALCYLASGRVDGFCELGLSKWDIAAGALIAQESGAIVSDCDGSLNHLNTGNILAAPPKIYKHIAKSVKQVVSEI